MWEVREVWDKKWKRQVYARVRASQIRNEKWAVRNGKWKIRNVTRLHSGEFSRELGIEKPTHGAEKPTHGAERPSHRSTSALQKLELWCYYDVKYAKSGRRCAILASSPAMNSTCAKFYFKFSWKIWYLSATIVTFDWIRKKSAKKVGGFRNNVYLCTAKIRMRSSILCVFLKKSAFPF